LKRFSQDAILNRLLQRLQVSENWSSLISQGTVGNLLNVIAEGDAEIARYLEYLYNEKKWINARNMSSITHLTDLISYKRQLPKSSIGFVIVSHTDLNGNNRLQNYGSYFFNLDQTSDWDNLIINPSATVTEKSSLVPWTSDVSYAIPKGTIFKTGSGIQFISTETVESRSLKEPFAAIKSNPIKYADFIKAGAWNGIKYVKVPVIQGEKLTIQFGRALGTRFESFTIDNLQVENASNPISNSFFKIKVMPMIFNGGIETESGVTETWEQIVNIRLAGPYDKVFEKKILNDENKVLIKFGDGITGQRLPERARISAEYLSTLGNGGNIDNRFQVVDMVLPPGFNQIDPRFNTLGKYLSCTNISPIMGGHDIESIDEIKLNAPPSYLETYALATKATYYRQIIKNSPVNLLHCRIFQTGVLESESYGSSNGESYNFVSEVEDSVLTEISLAKNALLITGIRANGTKIEDPENELIDPLIKAFDDNSSPNDTFDYIEPNFIEIRPNIIVNTIETLTENEIHDTILPEILGKYSIFSTDFEKSFYKSDIVDIVQNYAFSKYSSIFLEAKANINYVPNILVKAGGDDPRINIYNPSGNYKDLETLLSFKFKFDTIFSSNLLNAGFKNFRQNQPYVIRADIKFRSDPTRNKTLILYDNRIDLKNSPTLIEAENLSIDDTLPIPSTVVHQYQMEDLILFNEASDDYQNQQVRTAQFNYIDRIISPSYLYQMKQYDIDPTELRYAYIDEFGKNKIFNKNEITVSDDSNDTSVYISLNFAETDDPENIEGESCYWKNTQYIPNCKLMFYENYDNPKDIQYATGYLVIPLNKVFTSTEAQQLYSMFEFVTDYSIMAEEMVALLNNQFTLDVYAQPLMDDFDCQHPYDIIFTSSSNCLIQKNFLKSNQ
jgi:hypothetical protein